MDSANTFSVETAQDGDQSPRAASRASIFLGAQLVFPRSVQPVAVRVRNISPGGMMVDFSTKIPVGEQVVADVKGIGPVYGKVAWIANGRIGIAFDREINPQEARVKIGDGTAVPAYQPYRPKDRRPGLAVR